MGRLITLDDLIPDPSYYFSDAHYGGTGNGFVWMYEWPSNDYPCSAYIHSEQLDSKLKVEIRRWIEKYLDNDVMLDEVNKDYKIRYKKTGVASIYTVYNKWVRFSFNDKESLLVFTIKFSEYIRPITDWHPDRPEDKELLKKD